MITNLQRLVTYLLSTSSSLLFPVLLTLDLCDTLEAIEALEVRDARELLDAADFRDSLSDSCARAGLDPTSSSEI